MRPSLAFIAAIAVTAVALPASAAAKAQSPVVKIAGAAPAGNSLSRLSLASMTAAADQAGTGTANTQAAVPDRKRRRLKAIAIVGGVMAAAAVALVATGPAS